MGKQRSRIICRVSFLLAACFVGMPCMATAVKYGPDCSDPIRWPTRMTQVRLADFGFKSNEIDEAKTKTTLVASMPLNSKAGEDVNYRQVYHITFVTIDGKPINLITTTLASDDECSVDLVSVALISKEIIR